MIRILQGEAPTKYETVINLKAAKVVGLDVPPEVKEKIFNPFFRRQLRRR